MRHVLRVAALAGIAVLASAATLLTAMLAIPVAAGYTLYGVIMMIGLQS